LQFSFENTRFTQKKLFTDKYPLSTNIKSTHLLLAVPFSNKADSGCDSGAWGVGSSCCGTRCNAAILRRTRARRVLAVRAVVMVTAAVGAPHVARSCTATAARRALNGTEKGVGLRSRATAKQAL